jgi:hypothetical protein
MRKQKNPTSAARKKMNSGKSQGKSVVLSALMSLEPFSGQALIAAAQEGAQALKEKKTPRKFHIG